MHKKALTLIEVLVATVLIALVLLSLVNIFVVGRRYIRNTRSKMTAAVLGKSFLDTLSLDIRQDTWGNSTNCLSSSPTSGCAGASDGYTPTYSIDDVSGTNLRRVVLTLNWTENGP